MKKNYYIATTKCGHVRRSRFIPIDFAIEASNGKEAASIARNLPRVKHHKKDAIINVRKVSYTKFLKQLKINQEDSYLNVTSKQEQEIYCDDLEERVIEEKKVVDDDYEIRRKRRVNYLMKKRQIDNRINLSY